MILWQLCRGGWARRTHKSDSGEAAEVRMNAIVWGQGARMKREALEMLMVD